MTPEEIAGLEASSPRERLAWAVERFAPSPLFTSSFGAGSGVLLHLWSGVAPSLPVVFLDTGFLFPETLAYRDRLVEQLGLRLEIVRPKLDAASFLAEHGRTVQTLTPDLCCQHNKVDPLEPHVARARAWVSGLRRDQGPTRHATAIVEERAEGPVRIHPLVDLTLADQRAYLSEHGIPEHPLVARRYLSIGCAPCTRPVEEGEDERAGRWSGQEKTECGLHLRAS